MLVLFDHSSIRYCLDEKQVASHRSGLDIAIFFLSAYVYSQPVWLNFEIDVASDPKATARSIQASMLAGAGCCSLLRM